MANIKQLVETKPIANRTYNIDSGDIRTPYSFNDWKNKNFSIADNDLLSEYKKYVCNWYSLKTVETAQEAVQIKDQYVELLKQVLKDYEIDVDSFLKDINYSDITDLAIIIPHIVKSIKNEIIKIQRKRKELPKIIKSFKFTGTTQGIKLELEDYLLSNFYTLGNEYDLNKTSNSYPALSSYNKSIDIEVDELYDLTSNYFNSFYEKDIEDYVNLDVQSAFSLLSELSKENIKYAQEGRYYNFNWENVYSILNDTELTALNSNIAYLLQDSNGNDIETSENKLIELNFDYNSINEFPVYVFEKYDYAKNNLQNIVSIFKKYIGSDIYYHKNGNTQESGKLVSGYNFSDNILNLSEVSIANIQNFTDKSYEYDLLQTSDGEYIETSFGDFLSVAKIQEYNLKSKKEIGGYFIPDKCGISIFVDNNITWEIDWDNSESDKFYSYPNPNIYANSITTGLNQNEIPLIFYHSYDWILQSKAGELNGKVKNENKDQLFDGYQSSWENLQRNSLGLNCQDEILFLGESSVESPWLSADFISPDSDSIDYTWVIIPAMRQYPYLSNIPGFESIAETGHNVFKWIKNNKQKHKIDLVLCTGDLTTYNSTNGQWMKIRNWYKELDGIVPYIICKGEYDYGEYRGTGSEIFNERTTQLDNWFKPWDNNTNTIISNSQIENGIPYVNTIFDGDYDLMCYNSIGDNGNPSLVTYKDDIINFWRINLNSSDTSLSGILISVYKLIKTYTGFSPGALDLCYMRNSRFAVLYDNDIYMSNVVGYENYITSNWNSGEVVDGSNPLICIKYDPENDVFYGNINNEKIVKIVPENADWSAGYNVILLWDNTQSIVGNFEYDWENQLFYIIDGNNLQQCDLYGNIQKTISFGKLGTRISMSDDYKTLFTNTNPGILEYKFYSEYNGLLLSAGLYSQQSTYRSGNLSASCDTRIDLNNQTYEYVSPDNTNYLIFSTEFAPRDSVLSSISATLLRPEYENHNAILLTHAYLYPPVSGLSGRYSDDYDPTQDHTFVFPSITPTLTAFQEYLSGDFVCNDGKRIYEKLIRSVPNFKFVFCGHHTIISDTTFAERIDTTPFGNQVVSLEFENENTDGLIRLVEFMNGGSKIRLRTLSTVTEEFFVGNIFDHTITLSG